MMGRPVIWPERHYAPEVLGCPHVRPLLSRVLLAQASPRWALLSGLPVVRRRIQVRLADDAANRTSRSLGRAHRCEAGKKPREKTDLGTASPAFKAGYACPLSSKEPGKLA